MNRNYRLPTESEIEQIKSMYEEGILVQEILKRIGIHSGTLCEWKEHGDLGNLPMMRARGTSARNPTEKELKEFNRLLRKRVGAVEIKNKMRIGSSTYMRWKNGEYKMEGEQSQQVMIFENKQIKKTKSTEERFYEITETLSSLKEAISELQKGKVEIEKAPLDFINYKDHNCVHCGDKTLGFGRVGIGSRENPEEMVQIRDVIMCLNCFEVQLKRDIDSMTIIK